MRVLKGDDEGGTEAQVGEALVHLTLTLTLTLTPNPNLNPTPTPTPTPNQAPRPRSAERWYIWQESSPLATKNWQNMWHGGSAILPAWR